MPVTSIVSTSPPAPVTARPVARPGIGARVASSGRKRTPSEVLLQVGLVDHDRRRLAFGDALRGLARDLAELTLERTHTGLSGPPRDDRVERRVGDVELVVAQPGLLPLAREQVVLRDRDLLVLGVTVELHDLHAVEQRAGDRLELVRRREEQHVGEIEVELEVVVAERVVLRGIEHLQQRGRGVTAPSAGLQLVDLVDEQRPGSSARFGQRADDATGPRTDVRTPVTADLGLVAHTTDGDPHERAAEGARDRLTE